MIVDQTLAYWLITVLVFASVALLAFAAVNLFLRRGQVRQRFAAADSSTSARGANTGRLAQKLESAIGSEKLAGSVEDQRKLRADLMRAGFFSPGAPILFAGARLLLVIALPLVLVFAIFDTFSQWGSLEKFAFVGGIFLLAYYMPKAYLDRRARATQEYFRIIFPDFLDLLVVCVDAGLSLEAALERVSQELGGTEPALRANLGIMSAEMRAGRSTIEALHAFADRIGLDDARSMAILLQQSLELGTDVAQALTTYSEEMREKRTSRAEKKAYALPVKLTLPLGVFIFPVIMIVVMTPVIIRFIEVARVF
jgi:tight adherence protein C